MGALNPMNIFLRQEVDRMQRIISVVRTSLMDLKLAIEGTIIMSDVRCFHTQSHYMTSFVCLLKPWLVFTFHIILSCLGGNYLNSIY